MQKISQRTGNEHNKPIYVLTQQHRPQHRDNLQAHDLSLPATLGEERTRFYKKIYTKSAYDVFVEVRDCGHGRWQSSEKADKARKGLERQLGGKNWRSLHHCAACQGGGVWRLRW